MATPNASAISSRVAPCLTAVSVWMVMRRELAAVRHRVGAGKILVHGVNHYRTFSHGRGDAFHRATAHWSVLNDDGERRAPPLILESAGAVSNVVRANPFSSSWTVPRNYTVHGSAPIMTNNPQISTSRFSPVVPFTIVTRRKKLSPFDFGDLRAKLKADRTTLQHVGLVPAIECYGKCAGVRIR